jgi:predicted PurR-regulated permease PerM
MGYHYGQPGKQQLTRMNTDLRIRRSDIVFTFALALGLYIAWLVRDVLLLIYVSALFAVVLTPAIDAVRRLRVGHWHPSRGIAAVIIVVAGLAAIALFFTFALPPIFRDMQAFAADWPRRVSQLVARFQHLPYADRFNLTSLQHSLDVAIGGAVGLFTGIAGGVFWFFSWLLLTAYFIADGEHTFSWLMSLFPTAQRARLETTLLRAQGRVSNWLLGQGALMLILGCTSAIVFGLLRIKYFYALAVFAGLANIVPVVGPVASVILAATVAGLDSWTKLAGVLIFYFVYQQIENAFLTPRIMKSTVDLPPLAVIIALSLGASLAGILGALVAVPTAALVAVLLDEYLVKPHREEAQVHTEQPLSVP